MLFEPLALRFLCDVVGADKVMLGSDYPFGIGDLDPCGVVDRTALTAAEREAILGGNAARVFSRRVRLRRGLSRFFDPQQLDRGRSGQDVGEGVHPVMDLVL